MFETMFYVMNLSKKFAILAKKNFSELSTSFSKTTPYNGTNAKSQII